MYFFALSHALFTGRHTNNLVKLCAAVLAWCGVGSFGFHWTLSEAWSFLDTFPMTISSVLGIYLVWTTWVAEWLEPIRRREGEGQNYMQR